MAVLIYFLNHIATMIQLPVVIANIATTLVNEVTAMERPDASPLGAARGPSHEELLQRLAEAGAPSAHRAAAICRSSAMTSW